MPTSKNRCLGLQHEFEGTQLSAYWCFRWLWEAENMAWSHGSRALPGFTGLVPSKTCWYFARVLGHSRRPPGTNGKWDIYLLPKMDPRSGISTYCGLLAHVLHLMAGDQGMWHGRGLACSYTDYCLTCSTSQSRKLGEHLQPALLLTSALCALRAHPAPRLTTLSLSDEGPD